MEGETDLSSSRLGIVTALSLSEFVETHTLGKVFDQISVDDLKSDYRLTILSYVLDQHLAK